MKLEHKIIAASFLLGLSMWILDTVVDWLFFFQGTFWQSFVTMVAPHDAYLRVVVMLVFPIFGFLIAHVVAKLRRMEEALEESESALRRIIDFDQTMINAIPFGMEILDEDGKILFINKKMEELTGGIIVSKKCWDMIKSENQTIDCSLNDGIAVNKESGEMAREKVISGKRFQIIPVGIMYHGKKAMMAIYQELPQDRQ